jgi:hypothetical protein
MKIEKPIQLAVIAPPSTLNSQLSTCFGQGALTPPGAPAPAMKTLDQIEPRAPISAAPCTIANAGSYYLTTNVSVTGGDALTIAANDVTLDLNGFTISSTAASATGTGVLLAGSNTTGIGLSALIANSCSVGGGATNVTLKYNKP